MSGFGQLHRVPSENEPRTRPNPVIALPHKPVDRPPAEVLPPQPAPAEEPSTSGAKRAWTSKSVSLLISQVCFAFFGLMAGFVAFVLVFSALPQARTQAGLERRFKTPLSFGKAPVGGVIAKGSPVSRLDIPALGVHQVVVEGTGADQLRKGPGHLPVSVLPGQAGNAVLAAHRLALGGPFRDLNQLRPGARIVLTTGQGVFTYRLTGVRSVPTRDIGPLQPSRDNRLTLLTADGVWASRRLVAVASLNGSPQPAPAGQPDTLAASDGGLVGQKGALPALGLWAEVLLMVAVATVFTYRRMTRWSSYLITTPVILVAVWLTFENLIRLLPATL
jgi:sortase A